MSGRESKIAQNRSNKKEWQNQISKVRMFTLLCSLFLVVNLKMGGVHDEGTKYNKKLTFEIGDKIICSIFLHKNVFVDFPVLVIYLFQDI